MSSTVVERSLVDVIESTMFLYPAVSGLVHDLGIPGLRGHLSRVSHPIVNLAGDARFSEREADAMIEKVRERYGKLGFGWVTGPSTRPADLPQRLRAAGLQRLASLAGMALTDLATPIAVKSELSVREVALGDLAAGSEWMARAFGLPTEVMRCFSEILAGSSDRIRTRAYFAYEANVDDPRAWSFLGYVPDSPVVVLGGAATLPEHRGKGFYTALVAKRVDDAHADGRTTAVVQADRDTSAPICAALGFREICGLEIFGPAGR
jgi:GNAT superfamily N-acetyltransferase